MFVLEIWQHSNAYTAFLLSTAGLNVVEQSPSRCIPGKSPPLGLKGVFTPRDVPYKSTLSRVHLQVHLRPFVSQATKCGRSSCRVAKQKAHEFIADPSRKSAVLVSGVASSRRIRIWSRIAGQPPLRRHHPYLITAE